MGRRYYPRKDRSGSESRRHGEDPEKRYRRRLERCYKANPGNRGHEESIYKDKSFMARMRTQPKKKNLITYIDAEDVNGHEFRKNFERTSTPCIIRGITKNWKAPKKWQPKSLLKNYGALEFGVGGKDMALYEYMRYCNETKDDSPLYLFEESMERHGRKEMLLDYTVPEIFKYDFFSVLPTELRPPFRWLVMGPERSGSTVHIDPLGTSAWNTLLVGHKRWVLFPPGTIQESFQPKKYRTPRTDHEAVFWWRDVFPHIKKTCRPIECIQRPGETIFVPGGWWHGVLNLDFTIAVTQNFCSKENFERVYSVTCQERPRFSKRWKKLLNLAEPEMAQLADEMSVSSGSRWSPSHDGWSDVDDLPTLSPDDVGRYEIVGSRSDSGTSSDSASSFEGPWMVGMPVAQPPPPPPALMVVPIGPPTTLPAQPTTGQQLFTPR